MLFISYLKQTTPQTIGWLRSSSSWEPGSVLRGKGVGRGCPGARDAPKLLVRGGDGSRQPAGRRGLELSLPPRPRLGGPPGTRGSFHCCSSAVAMLEGEPLDLRSVHSAGHPQSRGGRSRPGARPTCARCGLPCETRRGVCSATRAAGSAAPGVPSTRARRPRTARARAAPLSALLAASAGPGAPTPGRRGRQERERDRLRGRGGALRAPSVREPAESGHPG